MFSVLLFLLTIPNHTYELPCVDLIVHRPHPLLKPRGGFGSDIWVYTKVDSSVANVHRSMETHATSNAHQYSDSFFVRELSLTLVWVH